MSSGQLGLIATGLSSLARDRLVRQQRLLHRPLPCDRAYLDWLARHAAHATRCAFATAPDELGDAAARARPMLARIRSAGYPAALVAQDGLLPHQIPWHECDVIFLGGTTG